jgi:hypothetical protein
MGSIYSLIIVSDFQINTEYSIILYNSLSKIENSIKVPKPLILISESFFIVNNGKKTRAFK